MKNRKPIKIIIEPSGETVNFADFMNEVIDFEDEEKEENNQIQI